MRTATWSATLRPDIIEQTMCADYGGVLPVATPSNTRAWSRASFGAELEGGFNLFQQYAQIWKRFAKAREYLQLVSQFVGFS